MKRLRLPATVDIIAVLGLVALSIGVGYRFGWDIAIALVGAFLLVYAILATRSETTP